MCLLSVAWQCSEQFPFVFAGNRDEYHARPTKTANWWEDAQGVLGGRDLVGGGSWLGISRAGRFAVVTNQAALPAPVEAPLSRGILVADWLRNEGEFSEHTLRDVLAERTAQFGGFNLLTATVTRSSSRALHCFAGGHGTGPLHWERLASGVVGLSNTSRARPWPKLTWLNSELSALLSAGATDPERLFALLQRDAPVPDAPAQGIAARPFIKGEEYGTRSSTIIMIDRDGHCQFVERQFGRSGTFMGESAFEFMLAT